jgi:hypothetical protein
MKAAQSDEKKGLSRSGNAHLCVTSRRNVDLDAIESDRYVI